MNTLEGKVAIVTGGSRGIGRATAIDFAKNGAKVVIYARDQEHITSVVEEIEAFNGIVIGISGDLSNEEDLQNVVAKTIKQFGRLDILANIGQGYTKAANSPL